MSEIISHTDGKRIIIRFDYDRKLVALVKTVPGSRWNPTNKAWYTPLTMDTCRYLRKVFGPSLKVSTELAAWARSEIDRTDSLEEFREGRLDSDLKFERLEAEAPQLLRAMKDRPYQLAGTAFGVAAGQFILGDEPGLGKTLQALAAIIESDARTILVACRRTAVRSVWQRETMRWAPGIAAFVAQGNRAERESVMGSFSDHPVQRPGYDIPGTRKMLIINIEMVRAKKVTVCPQGLGDDCPAFRIGECNHKYEATYEWPFLFEQEWDAIVLDESHNLLASTANIQSKRITQQRYGAVKLRQRLRPGGLAIALSGTPFRSKLVKGWGTLNWLRPDVFGSYWRWAETHFQVEDGRYGKVIAGGAKVPEPKDKEAWDMMLRPYYLARAKSDVAPDLPPIFYAGTPLSDEPDSPRYVQVDMEPAQEKLYQQMVADAEADVEGGRITATGVLAEITRLRQFASASGKLGGGRTVMPALPSNKIEWLVEFMQEREGTGRKVVVASSFTEIVELAARVLRKEGFEVLTLTGKTSDRDRAGLVARFQDPADSLQVVVINRKAGGESITLDAADEMVVMDPPWISDDDEQLEARIHRVSRVHQVTIYRLASTGTVDIWMAGLTQDQKQALASASPQKLSEMVKEAVR